MTIGFAIASWKAETGKLVGIAADTRISSEQRLLSDGGIKTYTLGGRAAVVVAGNALPAIFSAELVRPIIEDHNKHNDTPMGFYDTAKLFSYFLVQNCVVAGWSCEAVIAGFLQCDTPCLAAITVLNGKNEIRFFSVSENNTIAIPVGNQKAKALLMNGLSEARRADLLVFNSGLAIIHYMGKIPAYPSVGAAVSVGSCAATDDRFSWPIIDIDGKKYLRGIDVTESFRPNWPTPIEIEYDESRWSELDRGLSIEELDGSATISTVRMGSLYNITNIATANTIFKTYADPHEF